MRHFHPQTMLRSMAAAALLLAGACRKNAPTEPLAAIPGGPGPHAAVCAGNAAGSAWCTPAGEAGSLRGAPVCTVAKLLAWYRFDETRGNGVLDYANLRRGSMLQLHGQTARVPGKVRQALELEGDLGYAQGPADRNLGTGDFSIAVWLRMHPWQLSFSTLLDKREQRASLHGYHIAIGGGEPIIQLADGGDWGGWFNYHAGFSVQADGEWHFLVVTVERASATGVRWYYDGTAVGVVSDPRGRQGSLDTDTPLLIGRHALHFGGFYGAVDELQIVSRVLTPEEIAKQYKEPACS